MINGTNRADLPLLNGLFFTSAKEDFVKWDSGKNHDRIILFSTDFNLDCFQNSAHWFADGTFRTSPLLFDQLFVIHGLRGDGHNTISVPLVYCLTPNRTGATYGRIFSKLKELRSGVSPLSVKDFEQASSNAFAKYFPDAEQRSCFFHLRQANHRHIQRDSELLKKMADGRFNLHVRTLIGLAFVPPADVVAAYDELDASPFFLENKDVLDSYMDYFLNTGIGGFDRRGNRKKPHFLIPLWNCRDAVLQGLPKNRLD
ncbi:uncharacterized protein LOC118438707 isoform X1 [Folsomia candida]|uniref:MULE transposase domain-containing protein n=1 Tax=Folsomia candida TaxID=158441 RepID=A0A226DD05_FOLCA|nr:uncharacterized protein LOC118438707 isoform X1 [Folsomia candida]OXA42828.1 hypothetical protein Fcan01_22324 [Folsomia candida]